MLKKINRVVAKIKIKVSHLIEQHCVAHREDISLDDAWENMSIVQDIENLLRTVYTIKSYRLSQV